MTKTPIVSNFAVVLVGLLTVAAGAYLIRLDRSTAGSPSQPCPTVTAIPTSPTSAPDSTWTTEATARMGNVTLELRVPPGSRLMGEAVSVQWVAHNDGRIEVPIFGRGASVLDETGQFQSDSAFLPGDWPGSSPPPFDVLQPGGTRERVELVQLPFSQDVGTHVYHLSAQVQVGSPSAPDNVSVWQRLVASSPPLTLARPTTAQQLRAEIRHTDSRWCLVVLDGDGKPPNAPLTASMWAETDRGATGGLLQGEVKGVWPAVETQWPVEGGKGRVQIWVAGKGYVTALVDSAVSMTPAPPLPIVTSASK
jgi:hypothetical protein